MVFGQINPRRRRLLGRMDSCPLIGNSSNPYTTQDYYLPSDLECIFPGGGLVRPKGEYEVDSFYCDHRLQSTEGNENQIHSPYRPWGNLEEFFKKVGEKGITEKASSTIGYGAGWGTPREFRTVVGIFWPSQSEMVGHMAAGMQPWTKEEFERNLGTKIQRTIQDYTHGQIRVVGGGGLPNTGTCRTQIDYVWVGNPTPPEAGETKICGSIVPINCACGGNDPNAHWNNMAEWFNNNGYPNGWDPGVFTGNPGYVAAGYDQKIAISLDCFSTDITGNAGLDPMLTVNIDRTAGLSEEPFTEFDMTNAEQVLGSGRVAQVMLHEIGHGLGHVHLSKYSDSTSTAALCTTSPIPAPSETCNQTGYSYNGLDDLDTMSYGGGAENRFGLYRESHFSAYKKFLMGKIFQPWGPADIWDQEQFPPQCVHFPNIPTGGDRQTIEIFAHDEYFESQEMQDSINDSRTMLLLIRRDIDASQMTNDLLCNKPENQLSSERYLAISYRRKAWWREMDNDPEPENGALIIDWGPVRTMGGLCPLDSKQGSGVVAKINALDVLPVGQSNITFDSYTANGRSFPRVDLRIVENRKHPGKIGPPSILIEYRVTP